MLQKEIAKNGFADPKEVESILGVSREKALLNDEEKEAREDLNLILEHDMFQEDHDNIILRGTSQSRFCKILILTVLNCKYSNQIMINYNNLSI